MIVTTRLEIYFKFILVLEVFQGGAFRSVSVLLHTGTEVMRRSCYLEPTWEWAFFGGLCCMPQYTLICLLFAFQLADRPSGCNEWQNCWRGKEHSLFLNVLGGVGLHALICAAPLLLWCFFVLKASLHACTVVFSQKDKTKGAITIIFMTRLVTPESPEVRLSQQWGILCWYLVSRMYEMFCTKLQIKFGEAACLLREESIWS